MINSPIHCLTGLGAESRKRCYVARTATCSSACHPLPSLEQKRTNNSAPSVKLGRTGISEPSEDPNQDDRQQHGDQDRAETAHPVGEEKEHAGVPLWLPGDSLRICGTGSGKAAQRPVELVTPLVTVTPCGGLLSLVAPRPTAM